jgi:hypothetical protein
MAITKVTSNAASATSANFTTPTSGDYIFVFSYRTGSNTAPTLANGYTSIYSGGTANNADRVAYKVSDGTEGNTSVWTNANSVSVVVMRSNHSSPIGANANANGNSNSMSYPALTLQNSSGTSWILGFGGHRSANNVGQNAPSGLTLASNVATDAVFTSNGGKSSWTAQTAAVNAANGWRTHTIEFMDVALPTVTNSMVTNQTDTTCIGHGNVTANGGQSPTDRGFCWGANTSPTIANSNVSAGSGGTGAFTANITGLTAGALYYCRSYANNAAGTAYGNEIQFYAGNNGVYKDNFNRSNANPMDGDWGAVTGAGAIQITSNAGAGTSATMNGMYWTTAVNNNQYSKGKMTAFGTSVGFFTRLTPASANGYLLYSVDGTSVYISRVDGGVETVLVNAFATTITASDVVELRSVGSTHSYYLNGVSQTSTTDATYSSGNIGIYLYNTTSRVDDWEGGNVAGGAATISGAGNIASGELFGSLLLAATIFMSSIASAEAIGQPTITTGAAQSITGVGNIASAEAFGTPALSASISAAGITTGEAIGAPIVKPTIGAAGIATAEALGAPTISSKIAAVGITSGETFGTPALSVRISAAGVASAEAFGSDVLSAVVSPAGIASGEAIGQPVIFTTGSLTGVGGIDSGEAFGQPTISYTQYITGAGNIASGEALGQPYIFTPGANGTPKIILVNGETCIFINGIIYERL